MELSKSKLEQTIRAETERLGGRFIRLGGDCFGSFVDGEFRLGVSFKESTMKGTLWVGNPVPILSALLGRLRLPDSIQPFKIHPRRTYIALIHAPRKTLLLIPIVDVYQTVIANADERDDRSLKEWFDVEVKGYKRYSLRVGEFKNEIPVRHFDTLEPLLAQLASPLSEIDRTPPPTR